MRMRGARRFQMGGFNPAAAMNQMRSAGAPPPVGGVNPIPAPVGGAGTGAFTAGAPGNGLGAAPGLNPQAIQQALMQRRSMAGGPPMLGGPAGAPAPGWPGAGGPPPGAMAPPPIPPPGPGGASLGALPGGAPPMPPPAGMGAPPAGGPPPNPQMLQAALAAQQAQMGAAPPGFAKGGAVAQDGDTDAKKARPDRQWGKNKVAEDVPPVASIKKAKGGVMKRKPPKKAAPVPTPSPYDMAAPGGGPAAAAPPMGPPGLPPPGMKKGGKWIQGAIKKPGSLRKALGTPKGESIPSKKLDAAAEKGGKIGQKARLAKTLKGFKKNKGGACDRMAAGGAAKERKGFPKTNKPPKKLKFAEGGKVRGCGIASKGCSFSGIY